MDVRKLEDVMVKHGLIIRAVPSEVYEILEEKEQINYPEGKLVYLSGYDRKMLVVKKKPEHAGEFIAEAAININPIVQTEGKVFYKSINEILDAFNFGCK